MSSLDIRPLGISKRLYWSLNSLIDLLRSSQSCQSPQHAFKWWVVVGSGCLPCKTVGFLLGPNFAEELPVAQINLESWKYQRLSQTLLR